MINEARAYAKIVGNDWEYYMIKPTIILGRGGKDVECDVILNQGSVVSRQHFAIRFVPELQAFEIRTLSKNGILVNGDFLNKNAPPLLLRSQADIVFGRDDHMRLSFLLPAGGKSIIKKKDKSGPQVPLLRYVGEALLAAKPLNAKQIQERIATTHPNQLLQLGTKSVVASCIRHVLTQNNHIFFVHDWLSTGAHTSRRAEASPYSNEDSDACFGIFEAQKSRFFQRFHAQQGAVDSVTAKPSTKTQT